MSHQKQIKFGALLSYLSIALNIAAGLIYTPWMLSQIGESDYGLYTLANSIITLFLVDFGLSTATARFVSKYIAEGKQAEADNFLGVVYKLYLIIDAVIFAILLGFFFFIDSVYVNLTPLELEKFKVVYAIAGFYAVVNFPFVNLNGILTANERFIQQKFADIINRVLTVGLTIVALLLGMGLYALVAVHALAGLITIAYKLYSIRKHTATRANFRPPRACALSLHLRVFPLDHGHNARPAADLQHHAVHSRHRFRNRRHCRIRDRHDHRAIQLSHHRCHQGNVYAQDRAHLHQG